eukprot:gnl/TRDRNA2_/TRDRNA2_191835_c0_seq1.p1 gnl/TRDRNA2_/TRDRNA2_191835_c0~~gnl/TRDRNA2_/TRDRNA2_191835_c0_seq1.p1  ORF type:complete len:195 (+),score=20.86 gnl/TRDRNA2_/TRDRNA2_191835_c0_seq1:34-618(+)
MYKAGLLVLLLFVSAGVGAILFYAVRGCVELHKSSNAVYQERLCTVVGTRMDSWEPCSNRKNGPETCKTILLPKVIVNIVGEQIKDIEAHKYREALSQTGIASYEPDAETWLANFTVGSEVPCWQDVDDPEVVKMTDQIAADQAHTLVWPFASFFAAFIVFLCCCVPILRRLLARDPYDASNRGFQNYSDELDD